MNLIDILMAAQLAGGGGGSGLPSVTPQDVGKVLTVDNQGVWGASVDKKFFAIDLQMSSGINNTTSQQAVTATSSNWNVAKFDAILDAIHNNYPVYIFLQQIGSAVPNVLFGVTAWETTNYIMLICTGLLKSGANSKYYYISLNVRKYLNTSSSTVDATWSGAALPLNFAPLVSSSDAGKILTVNQQGEWNAENPPSGLPDVSIQDAGKVLMVNSSGEWVVSSPTPTPAPTVEQEYLVISVGWSSSNEGYIATGLFYASDPATGAKTLPDINKLKSNATHTVSADPSTKWGLVDIMARAKFNGGVGFCDTPLKALIWVTEIEGEEFIQLELPMNSVVGEGWAGRQFIWTNTAYLYPSDSWDDPTEIETPFTVVRDPFAGDYLSLEQGVTMSQADQITLYESEES